MFLCGNSAARGFRFATSGANTAAAFANSIPMNDCSLTTTRCPCDYKTAFSTMGGIFGRA